MDHNDETYDKIKAMSYKIDELFAGNSIEIIFSAISTVLITKVQTKPAFGAHVLSLCEQLTEHVHEIQNPRKNLYETN